MPVPDSYAEQLNISKGRRGITAVAETDCCYCYVDEVDTFRECEFFDAKEDCGATKTINSRRTKCKSKGYKFKELELTKSHSNIQAQTMLDL